MLGIIGTMAIIALSVNAFFVKSLLDSLNQVKIQTGILIEKSTSSDSRLIYLEKEVMLLRQRNHDIVNELGIRIVKLEMKIEEGK